MGLIREPEGVDFVVVHTDLTDEDRHEISKAITEYRQSHDSSADVREALEIIRHYEAGRTGLNGELAIASDVISSDIIAAPVS